MDTVQIAMANTAYRQALKELIARSGGWQVVTVDQPDLTQDGVVVLDSEHLRQMSAPIPRPERVVLIARNEPGQMSEAWEAGVSSVVLEREPPSTALLAVLSTTMRTPNLNEPADSASAAPGVHGTWERPEHAPRRCTGRGSRERSDPAKRS